MSNFVDCPKGQEKHEEYYSPMLRKHLIQYDYRDRAGNLFSCVAKSLLEAKKKRDAWLNHKG